MKVAVISNQETQCGRSSLILLLAAVFSRSQRKQVSIFSTGTISSMINYVDVKTPKTAITSISVFKAMLSTGTVNDKEIYDYALRLGEEEVFAFDIFSSLIEDWQLRDLFFKIINKIKTELILIEVVGSLEDEFNKEVLKNVDAVINVFNHNQKSITAVRNYVDNFEQSIVRRTGYVCQKFDPQTIGEKKLSTLIQMNSRNIMLLPYNPVIEKECLNGTLNTVAKYIISGNNEVVNLRMKLCEIMQFLFDSSSYKYIRGVKEWYK